MVSSTQEFIPSDLIPVDAYLFFPSENEIRRKSAKNPQRAIFEGNVVYNEAEEKGIKEFEAEVKKANVELPSYWSRSLTLRFVQAHSFKIPPTITAVQQYAEWAKKKLPMQLTPKIEQYLQKGIMYTFGRDNRFRPIFVINVYMIDPKEIEIDTLLDMITYFLEFVLDKMLLPGQVENWTVIADLGGQGVTSLPISSIKTVFGYLQNNYRARMHKSFIMNAPFTVKMTWNVVKAFLEESTVEKISMSSGSVNEDLFLQVNPLQVEEKFGGKAKNLTTYWPPKPCPDVVSVTGDNLSSLIVSQEVYAKYYEAGKLKDHKVNPELTVNFNPTQNTGTGEVVDVNELD